jgi:hypothetical protein
MKKARVNNSRHSLVRALANHHNTYTDAHCRLLSRPQRDYTKRGEDYEYSTHQ